jgi:hypothetical protein
VIVTEYRLGYRVVTAVALGTAAVGLVLPVLPTTPFLLLAAWSASRHSPALEARLLAHPRFGPHLHAWRHERAVSRRAKGLALAALALSFVVTLVLVGSVLVSVLVGIILGGVGVYLATRPEPSYRHLARKSGPCG